MELECCCARTGAGKPESQTSNAYRYMQQDNQLLSGFSEAEKVAYLSAIASIATADRQASSEEIQFLTTLAESADLTPSHQQEILAAAGDNHNSKLPQYLDQLKNSQLKYSLLSDMISFAKSDGQYSPEEEQRLKQVAQYLGINDGQYSALNQVADQAQQQNPTQQNFLQSGGITDTLQKVGISPNMMKGMLAMAAPLVLGRMFGGSAGAGRAAGVVGGGLIGAMLAGAGGGNNPLSSIFSVFRRGSQSTNQQTPLGPSAGSTSGGLGSLLTNILGGRGGFGL